MPAQMTLQAAKGLFRHLIGQQEQVLLLFPFCFTQTQDNHPGEYGAAR